LDIGNWKLEIAKCGNRRTYSEEGQKGGIGVTILESKVD
jgi:hypothetical protein